MSAEAAPAVPDVDPRRARVWLVAILFVALAIRVTYVLGARASPLFDAPQMDALYHLEWARAFARGEEFQPGPFFRAPLYPWFLGLCFRIFGEDLLVPRLVQAVLGTLSVAFVYRIGALVFDRRAGLVASALAATYWMLVYFEGELLLPVLEVLLDLLAIERTLDAGRRGGSRRWSFAGIAWGLAALVRPNVLAFVPVLAVWSLRGSGAWGARLARAAAFALGLAAAIAPVTLHNGLAGGDWVLVSSQGGVNFHIGNNAASDGSSAILPGTRPDWWGGYHDTIAMAERARGRVLKPSEVSAWHTERALDWMRAEPAAALRHQLWKLRLFWTDHELGNNLDERFFALRYGPFLRVLPFGFAFVAALGLLGLVLATRRAWSDAPLFLFVPVYMATVVAFFVCARFRVPILPPLMIFAGFAFWWLVDGVRSRRVTPVLVALGCAGLVFAGSRAVPAAVDRTHASGWITLGNFALGRGDPATAADCFAQACAEKPTLAAAHDGLGAALVVLGRDDEALASLRRALELDTRFATPASMRIVDVLLRRGAFDDALAVARAATEARPYSARGAFDAARVEYARSEQERRAGSESAARASLLRAADLLARGRALAIDADFAFGFAFSEGRIALELGESARAVDAFERALAATETPDEAGWFHEALRGLAYALERSGRSIEVQSRIEPHVRRAALDPRTRALLEELARPR